MNRRTFLQRAGALLGALPFVGQIGAQDAGVPVVADREVEWSSYPAADDLTLSFDTHGLWGERTITGFGVFDGSGELVWSADASQIIGDGDVLLLDGGTLSFDVQVEFGS